MSGKKNYNYFEVFEQMAAFSCDASKILYEKLTVFDRVSLQNSIAEIHGVEHAADDLKHEMMKKLSKEFLSPIEREDIVELAQAIDNVTDSTEDVLMHMYMFNVSSIREEAPKFCNIILECCEAMKKMLEEFTNFAKSTKIHEYIVNLNRLEEEGDKLYMDATRRLFAGDSTCEQKLIWRELFEKFEFCCDACEDVADVVESIIMKNT